MAKLIANVRVKIPGFVEADTRSQWEGYLDPGSYVVERYLENFPDGETDYALVQAPALGASDTWICTRWKDQRYAGVEPAPRVRTERIAFDADPLAVPEAALGSPARPVS